MKRRSDHHARDLATDVAYVAGLAITANHGRLTCPIGRGRLLDDDTVEVRVAIPPHGSTDDEHRAEVDTAVAELHRQGAITVDRYTPGHNAATVVRVHVPADSSRHWTDLASRATPTFAHDRAEA